MVRITPEVVENAPQFTNAIKDRELDLHGYKFPAVENLGSTLDQFDTIDLSGNEIRKLDGFPLLKRLKCLILTNNKIVRISDDLGQQLPNLNSIILTGNNLTELRDLDPLSSCEKLSFLSLLHCPVTLRGNYRLFVISRVTSLRFLDYRRVTQSERKLARSMFKRIPPISSSNTASTNSGQPKSSAQLKSTVNGVSPSNNTNTATSSVRTFIPGAPLLASANPPPPPGTTPLQEDTEDNNRLDTSNVNGEATTVERPEATVTSASNMPPPAPINTGAKRPAGGTTQDLYAIQEAIKRARTMDEVEHLNHLLSTGQTAGFFVQWQQQLRHQQQQKQQQQQQQSEQESIQPPPAPSKAQLSAEEMEEEDIAMEETDATLSADEVVNSEEA